MLAKAFEEGQASKSQFRGKRVLTSHVRHVTVSVAERIAGGDECTGLNSVNIMQRSKSWAGRADLQYEWCIAMHSVFRFLLRTDGFRSMAESERKEAS